MRRVRRRMDGVSIERYRNVFPGVPESLERRRADALIERLGGRRAVRSDTHADSVSLLIHEPLRKQPKQRRGDTLTPIGRRYKEILHLTCTAVARRSMSRDVADDVRAGQCQISDSRQQSLLRVMLPIEVPAMRGSAPAVGSAVWQSAIAATSVVVASWNRTGSVCEEPYRYGAINSLISCSSVPSSTSSPASRRSCNPLPLFRGSGSTIPTNTDRMPRLIRATAHEGVRP